MTTRSIPLRNMTLIGAVVIALLGFSTASAQSGRHVPKSKPIPVATPEATPAPATATKKPNPTTRFILGMDDPHGFSSASLYTLSGIRESCGERLGEPEWAVADIVRGVMARSDAIKRAKSEKDSYVVWLEVREDIMSSRQTGTPNNAYIGYTVFAPSSAKIITTGSTYPQYGKTVILDRRTSAAGDYYLNRAARDAADRILAKFATPIR